MSNNNKKKIELWRIIVFIISIMFIIYMWSKKEIAEIYATMPQEQIIPLIVTTLAVSLLKVAAIALGVLLVKWIVGKIKRDKFNKGN